MIMRQQQQIGEWLLGIGEWRKMFDWCFGLIFFDFWFY